MRIHYLAAVACLGIVTAPTGAVAPPAAKADDIAKLVQQLGSDDFEEREAAQKRLEAIGAPALDILRKTAASTDDAEVKSRAGQLIDAITAKVLGAETAKLQGSWKLVRVGEPGNGMTIQDDGFQIAVSGKQYTWKGSGFLSLVDSRGSFVLGELRGTKTIDLCAADRPPRLGVYSVDGDMLKLCVDFTQERHRPERLDPGTSRQLLLLTFQREKR